MGSYVWLGEGQTLPEGRGTIKFQGKAENDISIGLHSEMKTTIGQDGMSEEAPVYEIVIGGWRNTKSALRKFGQQQTFVTKKTNPYGVIQSNQFLPYWINISEDVISVGQGETVGEKVFISWKDPNPTFVCYIGFSSWDTTVLLRNIHIYTDTANRIRSYSDTKRYYTENGQCFLVNNKSLSDATILLGQVSICVHAPILYCASNYFKQEIEKGNTIECKDINYMDLIQVLHWCYGSKIQVQNKEGLAKVAERLQLPLLAQELDHESAQRRPDFSPLFKNQYLSDITLVVEDKKVPCHKAILSLASEHFWSMFTSSFRESSQFEIELHDLSWQVFELALRFIYAGSMDIPSVDVAVELLEFGERFSIYSLTQACTKYLQDSLEIETCCDVLNLSLLFQLPNLQETCTRFIENNFYAVSKTSSFPNLDKESLLEIIQSDSLLVTKEEQVYKAILLWGKEEHKEEDTAHLLQFVRYPFMNKDYLDHTVIANPLVSQNRSLTTKTKQALCYLDSTEDLSQLQSTIAVQNERIGTTTDHSLTPRKAHNATELLFISCGDQNGVFYFIGTQHNTQRWTNPHKSGLVTVTCSSPISRYTRPEVLVGRSYVSTSFAMGKPAWWKVDLGSRNSLICNYYTLHIGGGDALVRNWKLQGSRDDQVWTDLRTHADDFTFTSPGQSAAWPVFGKNASLSWRYFRVLMTGPASNATLTFSLCGMELYGYLKETPS